MGHPLAIAVARAKGAAGHRNAHVGRHGIAHAVPVRDDNRQASGHRLDRGKAECFLHIINGKGKNIGPRKRLMAQGCIAAVQMMIAHIGHQICGASFKHFPRVVI